MNVHNLIEKYEEPLIINRILSMNKENVERCQYINKFVFKIDKNITEYLFRFMFRGKLNYVPYISKKIGLRETNPLLLRIKKYYNWSDKELNNQKKYFMLLFQDEERLKEYENFFGQF